MTVHPKDLPNPRCALTLYLGMLRRGQCRALDQLLAPQLGAGCRDWQLLGVGAAAASGLQQKYRAIHLSRQALKHGRQAPRWWRARMHRDLGALYEAVDHPKQALGQFEKANALGVAQKVKFLLPYGRVLLALGQYRSATRILAEALRMSPDQADIARLLARACERAGLWGEACAVYQTLCWNHPLDAGLHLSLAQACYAGGERAAALCVARRGQNTWPDHRGFQTLVQMIGRNIAPRPAAGPYVALYEFAMAHDLAAEPQICAQIEAGLLDEHPQSAKGPLYLAAAKMAADLGQPVDSKDYERLGTAICTPKPFGARGPAQPCGATAPDRPPRKSHPAL